MKGIFIAYHNTLELFGFQYMPLEEMANGLFGTERIGEKVFRICVALLEKIMDAIQLCCPQQVLFSRQTNTRDQTDMTSDTSLVESYSRTPVACRVYGFGSPL